jgi:lysophospholipase L1-like esterase
MVGPIHKNFRNILPYQQIYNSKISGDNMLRNLPFTAFGIIISAIMTLACQETTTMPTETYRMLALGDSYTIGEAVAPEERWPVQLAERLRQAGLSVEEPQIIARTGWTTDELAAGIRNADPQGPFDLVTLLIGVNNQYRGRDPENFRSEFKALLQTSVGFAGGDTGRVIVISIPDWGVTPFAANRDRDKIAAEIDLFNSIKQTEAGRAGVKFIDITPDSRKAKEDPSLIAPDGLHPSGAMYRVWVDHIFPVARDILSGAQQRD